MYGLNYGLDGTVSTIRRLSDNACIPISDSRNYRAFLKWNSAQPKDKQLDLNSTIEPVKPEPPRDLAGEIDEIKAKITLLEKG